MVKSERLRLYQTMHVLLKEIGIVQSKGDLLAGYGVEHTNELTDDDLKHLVDLIVTMAVELKNIVENLEKKDRIMDLGKLIHRYENEADRLFHESLGELVSESHSPVEIIKFKELYERLERLTDSIDTVGKVIRGIRVKFG